MERQQPSARHDGLGIKTDVSRRQFLIDKALRSSAIANNDVEAILRSSKLRTHYAARGLFPVIVNPVIAHPKKGEKLGESIRFDGIEYVVPEGILRVHGGKNHRLLVLQRDFDVDVNMRISCNVAKVLEFPKSDAWRIPDAETGIPQEPLSHHLNRNALYGMFMKDGPYIGPLARLQTPKGLERYVFADWTLDEMKFNVGIMYRDGPL